MSRIVVDASVVAPFFLPDEAEDLREDVIAAMTSGFVTVPQHWRLEIANLARMAVTKRRLDDAALPSVVNRLSDFAVETDGETDRNAWFSILELSRHHDLTIYDAAYLELALRIGARLATSDKALIRAANVHAILLKP